MSDEIYRRLERLEATDDDMRQALNQLVVNTSIMNGNLEKLSLLEPRLRAVEDEQATNKIVLTSIRWLVTTIIGTALTVLTAAVITNNFGSN